MAKLICFFFFFYSLYKGTKAIKSPLWFRRAHIKTLMIFSKWSLRVIETFQRGFWIFSCPSLRLGWATGIMCGCALPSVNKSYIKARHPWFDVGFLVYLFLVWFLQRWPVISYLPFSLHHFPPPIPPCMPSQISSHAPHSQVKSLPPPLWLYLLNICVYKYT